VEIMTDTQAIVDDLSELISGWNSWMSDEEERVMRAARDLLTRQQEEIERLREEVVILRRQSNELIRDVSQHEALTR
jgi:hypothetical protein